MDLFSRRASRLLAFSVVVLSAPFLRRMDLAILDGWCENCVVAIVRVVLRVVVRTILFFGVFFQYSDILACLGYLSVRQCLEDAHAI